MREQENGCREGGGAELLTISTIDREQPDLDGKGTPDALPVSSGEWGLINGLATWSGPRAAESCM